MTKPKPTQGIRDCESTSRAKKSASEGTADLEGRREREERRQIRRGGDRWKKIGGGRDEERKEVGGKK